MVFLIQRAQNKESRAVQLKLNEIVASLEGASNRLIGVESLSEAEVEDLHRRYQELGRLLKQRGKDAESVSIDARDNRKSARKS